MNARRLAVLSEDDVIGAPHRVEPAPLGGKMFRIGHLGDFNDLMLMGTLAGVEMGLGLAGVPVKKEGVQAAMEYLASAAAAPARKVA